MPQDKEKNILIHRGAGERGMKVFQTVQWKAKCRSYFNRYYKTSRNIVVPSYGDKIMNALSFLCSETSGRGFVFKNYDIVKHLKFLGYCKDALQAALGKLRTSKKVSYIAYSEQKNVVFICQKFSKGFSSYWCLKNVATMVKYFLALYRNEIRNSKATVIGLLIREDESHEQLVLCSFCHLFAPLFKFFESPATIKDWWSSIENYEGWWKLENPKKQSTLFNDLASEILCFMATQEKGLPTLTDGKTEQFKQTYFLYTPHQMDIHFSDAKHVIIQGSYGSGKSMIGLKKLELILKTLKRDEKIIYVNFDRRSSLHFLMEKNLKEYLRIPSKQINHTISIRNILESPGQLIHVCHNSTGENLSTILLDTLLLNRNQSKRVKTNSHLIVEEYDGEELTYNEAARITTLVESDDLRNSNIILLAQPLRKNRSWNVGDVCYERETCVFHELEKTFKIVKLEEVLRSSNEICGITKNIQSFLLNKDSVFKTEMDQVAVEDQPQQKDKKELIISSSVSKSNSPEVGTSINEKFSNPSHDSSKADENPFCVMDLDQAFKRSTRLKKSKAAKSKIVSKFGFLCECKQVLDIEGLKPSLVEFSEDIDSTSDVAVVALALVLKNCIGEKKRTTVLHMDDEQPRILKRTMQVLRRLLDETFSYTEDIRVFLQKDWQSKTILSSNVSRVNGLEFDHVVIVVSQAEYYLKYYLPQAISRCTYDLTIILLPKGKLDIKEQVSRKLSIFSRTRNDITKETAANIAQELKRECLVNQVVVTECKDCEKNCFSNIISNLTDNKQMFEVHTHSDQYKHNLFHLTDYAGFEEQPVGTNFSVLADNL